MIGIEQFGLRHHDRAKIETTAGHDRDFQIAQPLGMIDFQFRFAGLCEGVAIFHHRCIEPTDRIHDLVAVDDRAGLQTECIAEFFRIGRDGIFQTGQGNRVQLILRSRLHVDDHFDAIVVGALEARLHDGVIITLYPEQTFDQFGIALGASPDLGEIGLVAAIFLEHRQYFEARIESLSDRVRQSFKADPVGGFCQRVRGAVFVRPVGFFEQPFLGRDLLTVALFFYRRGGRGFRFTVIEHRFGRVVQVGPFHPEIRKFGQRLIRVERRFEVTFIRRCGGGRVLRLGTGRPDE